MHKGSRKYADEMVCVVSWVEACLVLGDVDDCVSACSTPNFGRRDNQLRMKAVFFRKTECEMQIT